jgi:predicted nuclease with TOPRIM domain
MDKMKLPYGYDIKALDEDPISKKYSNLVIYKHQNLRTLPCVFNLMLKVIFKSAKETKERLIFMNF